jgi:hypothetical protein
MVYMLPYLPPDPHADYSVFCENTDVRLSYQVRQAPITCHINSRTFSGELWVQVDSSMAYPLTEFVSIAPYSAQEFVVMLATGPTPVSYEAIVRVTPADLVGGQARSPDSIIRVTFAA